MLGNVCLVIYDIPRLCSGRCASLSTTNVLFGPSKHQMITRFDGRCLPHGLPHTKSLKNSWEGVIFLIYF
jgi:hypothetical protein